MKRNTQLCFILMLISVGVVRSVPQKFSLTKISALTSRIPGSGMDQGISIFGYDSGGSYSVVICQGDECCATGKLNTEDDNWELGQVDWFVGRQIGDCEGMELDPGEEVRLVLHHEGSNAGLLDWVRLHSWSDWEEWECEVRVRLDYSNSHSTLCHHSPSNLLPGLVCNGRTEFCRMRFDQFLFPGAHNAGTGQRKGSFACAFKNQDLNIEEQLEFGIRFFDIDIIFSHSHGCQGLETGHGKHPDLGLYQCYGKLSSLLTSLRTWLDNHPSEVVTLNFGNIEYPESTIPELQKTMNEIFPTNSSGVKMNGQFKSVLAWPTLGECVRSNERIFVFVRDTVGLLAADSQSFVKEIKVKPELLFSSNLTVGEGEVTIMTSYQAGQYYYDGESIKNIPS